MKAFAFGVWFGAAVLCSSSLQAGAVAERDGELLDGKDWQALALITGFHSVQNKKVGFEARLLEADGSQTVAQDPVALYLVVNAGETGHTWRIRRGVERVRSFVGTPCGADVRVDVDRITAENEVRGTIPRILRLCFLGPDGKVQARLRVSEMSR